nr:hypothetical protein Itr_chr05CG02940 [Ipomoea trifida]GMC96975.1 hypothetical protein Iba_chr05dCG2640 [Ipomoea batatas]
MVVLPLRLLLCLLTPELKFELLDEIRLPEPVLSRESRFPLSVNTTGLAPYLLSTGLAKPVLGKVIFCIVKAAYSREKKISPGEIEPVLSNIGLFPAGVVEIVAFPTISLISPTEGLFLVGVSLKVLGNGEGVAVILSIFLILSPL